MNRYFPSEVLMLDSPQVTGSPVTRNVLENIAGKGIPVSRVTEEAVAERVEALNATDDPFRNGKKILLLTENEGEFLKRCPGTNEYICCDYHIIDFAQNCPMDCTYCILQAYLNNPMMVVYANVSSLAAELDRRIPERGTAAASRALRIGTGEFTDSLALDHLTGYSDLLMDYFAGRPELFIEFKTKTDIVDSFLGRDPLPNVLLSWSVNALNVTGREEHRSASMEERMAAARKCADAGYAITLHFDPIIDYDDFGPMMKAAVEMIFDHLRPESIKYISFGCYRFIPKLKDIVASRFPNSKIIYNEFIKGYDGKSRYFRKKRERLFKTVREMIEARDPERKIGLYYCMESPEIWRATAGNAPGSDEELGKILYRKCLGG